MPKLISYISFLIITLFADTKPVSPFENITRANQNCEVTIVASTIEPCGQEPVIFQIENPNPGLTYRWNFGDLDADLYNPTGLNNNLVTGEVVMHAFTSSDTGDVYIVSVVAYDEFNIPCDIDFQKITTQAAPQAVLFDDNGTNFLNCPAPDPDIFRLIVSNREIGNGADLYRIDWGDGSPVWESTTPPDFLPHNYEIGAFDLTYTVIDTSLTCQTSTANYFIYNGTDPDLGLSINGRTSICAPDDITFNILNTEKNTAGTIYYFTINDGSGTRVFTQETVPTQLVHVFDSVSCNTLSKTEIDAYELSVKVENPCGKKEADIRPIKVGRAPTAKMTIFPSPPACDTALFILQNITSDGIDFRESACSDQVNTLWNIIPLDGGNFTYDFGKPNRDSIGLRFGAGKYIVQLETWNNCGSSTAQETITVVPTPLAGFTIEESNTCTPTIVKLENEFIEYNSRTELSNPQYKWSFEYAPSDCVANSEDLFTYIEGDSTTPSITLEVKEPGLYRVRLSVVNDCGGDVAIDSFVVSGAPFAEIVPTNEILCNSATLDFSVQNISGCNQDPEFIWRFPGAQPSTFVGARPTDIFFPAPGKYPIEMSIRNGCDTVPARDTIIVQESPIALARTRFTPESGCLPVNLEVTNLSTGDDVNYRWAIVPASGWTLLDGSRMTDAAPKFRFDSIGEYRISMAAASPCDTTFWAERFTIIDEPEMIIDSIPNFCDSAVFQPTAFFNNAEMINDIVWEFPGASIERYEGAQPDTIVYDQPGIYTIRVSGNNECGQDSHERTFMVLRKGEVNVMMDSVRCLPNSLISVNNTSFGDSLSYTWTVERLTNLNGNWTFANGTSENDYAPEFDFQDTGQYKVTLMVNSLACDTRVWENIVTIYEEPTVIIEPIDNLCDAGEITPRLQDLRNLGRIDSISWEFPGANITNSDQLQPPPLSYENPGDYSIIVGIFNRCGVSADTVNFKVLEPIIAEANLDTTLACTGDVISVDNRSTGRDLSYTWTVQGSGQVLINNPNAFEPTLTFPDTGWYTVSLEVTNQFCSSFFWEERIFINEPPEVGLQPIEDLCVDTAFIVPQIAFISEPSLIDSIRWEFPGAANVSGANTLDPPALRYDTSGTYQVIATVFNSCSSASDTVSFQFYTSITALAIINQDVACIGEELDFTNLSTGDDLTYRWDITALSNPEARNPQINDPSLSEPSIVFLDTGLYEITLNIENPVCEMLSWRDTFLVGELPMVELAPIDNACEEALITPFATFSDTNRMDSIQWSFPGGQPAASNRFNPGSIRYDDFGEYTITVKVYNDCGIDSSAQTFFLDTIPIIHLGAADTICLANGIFQIPPADPPGGIWRGQAIIDSLQGLYDPGLLSGSSDPFGRIDTIRYVYTQRACEIISEKEIVVVDLSALDAGPPVDVCISERSVQLGGALPAGGWYEGPGIIDSTGIFDPSGLGAGAYVLRYNFQFPGTACTASDTFLLNIRPLPVAGIGPNDNICTNTPATFQNLSSGGVNYFWYIQNRDGTQTVYNEFEPSHMFQDVGFQNVKLVVESEYGCRDSITTEFFVSGPPIAIFEIDTTFGCAPLEVNIINNSIGYRFAEYFWDFGNGQTSTRFQPSQVIFEQGLEDTTYVISLTVQNRCEEAVYVDSVKILPKPVPIPVLSEDFGCDSLLVEFGNLSRGLTDNFEWSVTHRGQTRVLSRDSFPPPEWFRADSSTYEYYYVTLTGTNECGDSSVTREIVIKPEAVQAAFAPDTTQGCEPLTINFTNFTSAPDEFVNYRWLFGDQDSTNSKNASYTFYTQNDTITEYEVTLIAENITSSDSLSILITVFPEPDLSIASTDTICFKDSIQFFSIGEDIGDFQWDFGDDSEIKNDTNPKHFYQTPGIYEVILSAQSKAYACPIRDTLLLDIEKLPEPVFEVSNYFGCPPLQINIENQTENAFYYLWDYGDGNTAVGENPAPHTYTESGERTITLTASDEKGCSSDTSFNQVEVYPVPTASFDLLEEDDCGLPRQVCFNNTSEGASGFEWTFGNGEQSNINNPCVEYQEADSFYIELITQNEFLCADTMVQGYLAAGLPFADFEPSVMSGCAPLLVDFSNLSEFADEYWWVFSDQPEDTIRSRNPTRIFEQPGSYSVTLFVKNGRDCMDSIHYEDLIVVYPSPVSIISYDKVDNALPTTIQFVNMSDDAISSSFWDLGDGKTSTERHPMHRYLSFFDKTVTLEVENQFGCIGRDTARVALDTITNLSIPNILEPESIDRGRQIFLPKGISLAEYHIAIYSRNGTLVWESTTLDNQGSPVEFWDGTLQQGSGVGSRLPSGVYVWEVKKAIFVDGTKWDGMLDKNGVPRKSNFVYLLR